MIILIMYSVYNIKSRVELRAVGSPVFIPKHSTYESETGLIKQCDMANTMLRRSKSLTRLFYLLYKCAMLYRI